jgi:hypothetical protein
MERPKTFVTCPICNTETEPHVFENPQNWRTIEGILKLLGYDIEQPAVRNQLKQKLQNHCATCGETLILREALTKKLRATIKNEENTKQIVQALNNLLELSKESQWKKDKTLIFNEIFQHGKKLNILTAFRMFVVLQSCGEQQQHLEEWEKDTIAFLRNTLKMSLSSIAFILQRSKESIHRNLGVLRK